METWDLNRLLSQLAQFGVLLVEARHLNRLSSDSTRFCVQDLRVPAAEGCTRLLTADVLPTEEMAAGFMAQCAMQPQLAAILHVRFDLLISFKPLRLWPGLFCTPLLLIISFGTGALATGDDVIVRSPPPPRRLSLPLIQRPSKQWFVRRKEASLKHVCCTCAGTV